MIPTAQMNLEQLAATREDRARNDAERALRWGKRKNWCNKASKIAAALLAGAAAVLAGVEASKALTASIAGASAALGVLAAGMNFAREAAVDYTVAAEYQRLAGRYEVLLATWSELNPLPDDAIDRLDELADQNELIRKQHAAVV